jgi:hypothetical protein
MPARDENQQYLHQDQDYEQSQGNPDQGREADILYRRFGVFRRAVMKMLR